MHEYIYDKHVQRVTAHSKDKLDSAVIDEFTTNDELLSPSSPMDNIRTVKPL